LNFNISLFTPASEGSVAPGSSATAAGSLPPITPGAVTCPNCNGDVVPVETETRWQSCPYCGERLQIWLWPTMRHNTSATAAMPDQATCFFHPDKAFHACCQRCGRFVCALCDLQLGAEHVCPTCFERGRADTGLTGGQAEWRHRDVLYDSIALAIGWCWIIFWPVIVAALPAAIFLHVKYRRALRSYLIPRSGWRFWVAYAGFAWIPLLIIGAILVPLWIARRH
jgi:hypothetical protein